MMSLRSTISRPLATQRSAARPQRLASRLVVRSDKAAALKELEEFQKNAAAMMKKSLDDAEAGTAAPSSTRRVMAAQVVEESAEAVAGTAPAALRELTKDDFHEFITSADTLVVVDFFTDWCGPCKMIYPELVKLNAELAGKAQICKFNCNAYNKDLGKQLAIKVAPTFHLYKGGAKVAEMTGAKVDKLRALVQEHM